MDNYAVIGYPIKHSLSPSLHNRHFEAKGDQAYYTGYAVHPNELQSAVDAFKTLNIKGWNVTVPHKVDIMKYLDEIDHEASMIGAVNTVVNRDGKLTGYNTDSRGYLNALLTMTGDPLKQMNVLVIGAGGASRAVVFSLLNYGVKQVSLTNRTAKRAEDIQRSFAGSGQVHVRAIDELDKEIEQYDVVINTTSIGLNGEELQLFDTKRLRSDVFLSDLIYNPKETAWLKNNKKNVQAIQNGLGMFVEQAALAYELWTERRADRLIMEDTVIRKLGKEHEAHK